MLRACEILLTLFLTYGINGKQNVKEKEDVTPEETYQRHVVEEGIKAAIFGSNSYDPINQVFESLQGSNFNNSEVADGATEPQERKFFDRQSVKTESAKLHLRSSTSEATTEVSTPFTTGKAQPGGDSWWSGYKFRAGALYTTQ